MTVIRTLQFGLPYKAYIDDFYSRHPGLQNQTFAKQDAALKEDFFPACSDAITHSLKRYGHDGMAVIMNVESIQRAWARENRPGWGPRDWFLSIARAQVMSFDPHVLFIDPYAVPTEWLRELRESVASLRLLIARYSSPRADLRPFAACDIVVSGDSRQVDELRSHGINGHLLHHAFDERVLSRLPAASLHPVVFFGGLLRRYEGFHLYRKDVLTVLAAADIPLELRLLADDVSWRGRMKQATRRLVWDLDELFKRLGVSDSTRGRFPPFKRKARWQDRPPKALDRALRSRAKGPVFGLEMFAEMRASGVTLNVHGDVSRTEANNLRLWEATGVGSCLLTDRKDNLGSLFEVGTEVIDFGSPAECVEHAQWLLEHPTGRADIATRGQQRTLRDHTYSQRAPELDALIRASL